MRQVRPNIMQPLILILGFSSDSIIEPFTHYATIKQLEYTNHHT